MAAIYIKRHTGLLFCILFVWFCAMLYSYAISSFSSLNQIIFIFSFFTEFLVYELILKFGELDAFITLFFIAYLWKNYFHTFSVSFAGWDILFAVLVARVYFCFLVFLYKLIRIININLQNILYFALFIRDHRAIWILFINCVY